MLTNDEVDNIRYDASEQIRILEARMNELKVGSKGYEFLNRQIIALNTITADCLEFTR